MTIGLAIVSNQNQTTLLATWPRLDTATVQLVGWLLVALIMPILATAADVVIFAEIGSLALPIALAALGWVVGLWIDEIRGTRC